jgi:hypothetical protein
VVLAGVQQLRSTKRAELLLRLVCAVLLRKKLAVAVLSVIVLSVATLF